MQVTIYAKEFPSTHKKSPYYASLFPSASIIPHSVYHPDLTSIFTESQRVFSMLYQTNYSGLRKHQHFELYGFETKIPEYAKVISGFKTISKKDWAPIHPKIKTHTGYSFNCFFADWNFYFDKLFAQFRAAGGTIVHQSVDLNTLHDIDQDVVINCSGLGSHQLEDDVQNPLILKGHLIKVSDTPPLVSPEGSSISYNFTPGNDIYSDSYNNPLDIYCYPRKNDWVLGGSRFEGTFDKKGKWVSKDPLSEDVPREIEQLNSEIINNTFDLNLNEYTERTSEYSYRYIRNKVSGLRLDKDPSRMVFHNYGHGGAGVTLSWGCAFRILGLLYTEISQTPPILSEVIEKLSKR